MKPPPSAELETLTAVLERALPDEVRTVARVLKQAGFRCWLVGGSVRDLIRQSRGQLPKDSPPGDWDLCSDARPEQVKRLFRQVIPTGIAHGTVTVVLGGQHFELTTLRGEVGHSDGRHPDSVYFVDDLEVDLARRDFTVNAIAYDLDHQRVIDPFDGQGDLERGVLRAVGEPLERFAEDGLRVLRCARFASTLTFAVEEQTRAAIRPSRGSFQKVAQERVRDEWVKALKSATPSRCFSLLRAEGLLAITAPDLFPTDDLHTATAYQAACALLDRAAPDPLRRLAILCVLSARAEHLATGIAAARAAGAAAAVASRLRCSSAERVRLVRLATFADGPGAEALSDGRALRRWMRAVGRDSLGDVCQLMLELAADDSEVSQAETLERHVKGQLESGAPLGLRDLAIAGRELMDAGLPAGPNIGRVLEALLEVTLDDPSRNTQQELLSLALRLK